MCLWRASQSSDSCLVFGRSPWPAQHHRADVVEILHGERSPPRESRVQRLCQSVLQPGWLWPVQLVCRVVCRDSG